MTVKPISFQTLNKPLGEYAAIRQCTPTAFYMLLEGAGYIPEGENLLRLCKDLEKESLRINKFQQNNWSRPLLTRYLRHRYHALIVSWQINWPLPPEIDNMVAAGYLESEQEIEFFKNVVYGHSVEELVRQGLPVIVTVGTNFANLGNTSIHSVIILEWSDNGVVVIDPDGRNVQKVFTAEYINQSIVESAAGSIVLPKP